MPFCEIPLSFSASLAQSIGVNEAILVGFLQQSTLLSNGQFVLTETNRKTYLGFWSVEQTHRVFMSLQKNGLIDLHQSQGGKWIGLINLAHHAEPTNNQVINNQIDDKPISNEQESRASYQPSSHQVQESNLSQVEEGSVNEARLYNQNRANPLSHLQTSKSLPVYAQSGQSLSKMNLSWQPSEQFHEMLRLHNISVQFANEQLPVFKQYYIDSGKTAMSWDSRFINWVQRAKASARSLEGQYEQPQSYSNTGHEAKHRKEEVRKKLRDINDTSWADGLFED